MVAAPVDRRALMAASPNVRLHISNRPENVSLVREMLTGVAESVDLDSNDLNDIRTAVTEACNNVVLHAYEGEEGPLEVEVYACTGAIEVVVRDHGVGIQPRIRREEETALGIGLHVIQALAQRVEFRDASGRGTDIRMEFATPPILTFESLRENGLEVSKAVLYQVTVSPPGVNQTAKPRCTCKQVIQSLEASLHRI